MICRLFNIFALLILFAGANCFGEGFTNMPLSEHEGYSWYNVQSNSPMRQLWNATCERITVSKTDWAFDPTHHESWWVGIAPTNKEVIVITTNYSGTVTTNFYTNVYLVVSNVLRNVYPTLYPTLDYFATNFNATNNIGPFEYTYDETGVVKTATAYPHLDASLLYFVGRSLFVDLNFRPSIFRFTIMNDGLYTDSYDDYFLREGNDGSHPNDFPMQSEAGLFYRGGFGATYNRETNKWGVVVPTNGLFDPEAGYGFIMLQPMMDMEWWLIESHTDQYAATNWTLDFSTTFSRGHTNESQFPILYYSPGSTNLTNTFTFTLTGLALELDPAGHIAPSQTFPTQENITIDNISVTQTVDLTHRWYSITSITNEVTNLTAQSTIQIKYDGEIILFDPYHYGGPYYFRLYQENIDVFYHILTNLIASKARSTYQEGSANGATQGVYQWQGFDWNEAAGNKTTYTTNLQTAVYAWAATTEVAPNYLIEHYDFLQDIVTVTNDSPTKPDWRYKVEIATTGIFTIVVSSGSGEYLFKTWIENSISGMFSNSISVPGAGTYPINISFDSEYAVRAGIDNNVIWDFAFGWLSGGGGVSIKLQIAAETVSHVSAEILAERSMSFVQPHIEGYSTIAYWTNRITERELYFHGAIYPDHEHFPGTPLANLNFTWEGEGGMINMNSDTYARVWFEEGIGTNNPSDAVMISTIPFYGDSGFEEKGWFVNDTLALLPLWLIKHDLVETNKGFNYW